jgi:hypothetical protein
MDTKPDSVQICLSWSEALVLFEWLALIEDTAALRAPDAAEQQVLWRLQGQLETLLTDVVAPDYQDRVARAKRSVLGQ